MAENNDEVPFLDLAPPPSSTISSDEAGRERIVTNAARASLMRSREGAEGASSNALDDAARRWLETASPCVPQVCWPAKARWLVEERDWETPEELAVALSGATGHVYVVFWRRPANVFAAAPIFADLVGARRYVTPILVYGTNIVVGPLFDGTTTTCAECWAARLRTNVPTLAARAARDHAVLLDVTSLERSLEAARLLWEVPLAEHPPTWALTIDRNSGSTTRSPIRPCPTCTCAPEMVLQPLDEMADPIFGTAVSIGRVNASRRFPIYTARTRLYEDCDGSACAMSPSSAKARAMAECIERITARHPSSRIRIPPEDPICSAARLVAAHPFMATQYATPGFPYEIVEDPARVAWVEGLRWPTGEREAVPLACVSLAPLPKEPRFAPRSSTGIAAHSSRALAAEAAILELVERDVATRCWFEGQVGRLDAAELVPTELRALERDGLEVMLGVCSNEASIPVLIASVADRATGLGAFGTCARPSLAAAASHAVEDAMLMYVHRSPNRHLPVRSLWSSCSAAGPSDLPWFGDLRMALAHYLPIVVDLTHAEAEAAGLYVCSVWSHRAVDFPLPGHPIEGARWDPSAEARRRLARAAGVFRGGVS